MKKQGKAVRKSKVPLTVIPDIRSSYQDITLVNPKKEPLTPAALRNFEGFTGILDEAENICRTSLLFAQALLEFIAIENNNCIDNQDVINLK